MSLLIVSQVYILFGLVKFTRMTVKSLTTAILELLSKLVCDLNTFHNCDLCPEVEKLREHIKYIFTEADAVDDD